MAACSEAQIDGTVATDLHSNFPVSAAGIQNSEAPVKSLRTSERILSQKVSNTGVEEPNYSSLPEEELECLLKELSSHRPKREASLLVQHLLEGVRDADDVPPAPHGVPCPQPPGIKTHSTVRNAPRKQSSISAHRSLQDLPALQDAMRSAGLGRSRPMGGGRAVRAHSLSDHQDFHGVENEEGIEMHTLTRKTQSADQDDPSAVGPLEAEEAEEPEHGARNGLIASEEEKGEEEGKSHGLVLPRDVSLQLFPFPLQLVGDGSERELPKTFCGNNITAGSALQQQFSGWRTTVAHTNRCHEFQSGHNSMPALRKGKKARTNAAADTVLAKNIVENNCGDLPIDRLLEFICSGDKRRNKTTHNNNLATRVKNSSSATRKPPSKGGSTTPHDEDETAEDLANNNFVEGRLSLMRRDKRDAAPLDESPTLPSGGTPERSLSPSFYSDQGMDGDGSYRVDVSSFSDVDQIHEECEFRVVTKKHRRKMQPKKVVDNFRQMPYCPRVPPFERKNSNASEEVKAVTSRPAKQASEMMRRKSAGSAPHSDQSSPENSDLDSVHSLPVSGGNRGMRAAPAASAPQTSYADIARMSCARRARDFPLRVQLPDAPVSTVAEPPLVVGEFSVPVPLPSNGRPASRATAHESETVRTAEGYPASSAAGDGAASSAAKRTTTTYRTATECPAVVIMDGEDVLAMPSSLGEITFGFDVNEQLLRMTLNDTFAPSAETPGGPSSSPVVAKHWGAKERKETLATGKVVPRFEGSPDDVGRFNYGDVVDYLDRAWNKAYQSYEKEVVASEKQEGNLRALYYCDAGSERS